MKVQLWILAGFFVLWGLLPAQAFERRQGARPLGMGDAFVALSDDMNALNYNPAGLAQVHTLAASIEYANLYPGLDDGVIQENHLAYVQPFSAQGGFGIAWNNRAVLGVYHENEFIFGCGLQPSAALPFWAGITAKLFYLGYTDPQSLATNAYLSGLDSKYQFGCDAAVLYEITTEQEPFPGLRAGLSLLNLNEPDLGLRGEAKQPLEIRLGGSGCWQEWDGAVDLVWTDPAWQVHTGVEKWFLQRTWAVRAGVMAGDETGLTWTLGGSYAFDLGLVQTRLDYAFNYSFGNIQETAGIHRLSLDFFQARQAAQPGRTAGQPETAAAGSAPAEGVKRIRNYLMESIENYFRFMEKIKAGKEDPALQGLEALSEAEEKLHHAVGQLVLNQDIIGFLHLVEEAGQLLQSIDIRPKDMPGGP